MTLTFKRSQVTTATMLLILVVVFSVTTLTEKEPIISSANEKHETVKEEIKFPYYCDLTAIGLQSSSSKYCDAKIKKYIAEAKKGEVKKLCQDKSLSGPYCN